MENLKASTANVSPSLKADTLVRWKSIAPTLLFIWIVGMIDKIGVAVIATNKSFLSEMHLAGNNALIGSLVTALLFSYGIGFFIWGWIVDRYGPRRSAIVGMAMWSASTLMAALTPNFQILFISRIILGFSEACLWPVSNALTARWFSLNERGRAKSIWVNGTNIGPAISGFVVIFLMQQFQWRGVFWFLTLLAAAICIPMIYFFIKDDPAKDKRVSESELKHIKSEQLVDAGEHRSSGKKMFSFALVIIAFTATIYGVFGLGTWFPSYLAIAKHMSPGVTSTYILLAWMLGIPTMLLVGKITDKTHRKAVWNVWAFAIAALLLFLSGQIASPVVDVLLVAFAICLINGVTTLIAHALLHSMSSTERMGKDAGIMTGVSNVLGAFGPTVMGALITFGHGTYGYAFGFLIISFLIGSLCGVVLKRHGY